MCNQGPVLERLRSRIHTQPSHLHTFLTKHLTCRVFFSLFLSPVNLRAPVLLLRRPRSSINYGCVSDSGSLRRLMTKHKKNVLLHSSVGGRRSVNVVHPSWHFFFFLRRVRRSGGKRGPRLIVSYSHAVHVQSCGDVFFLFSINKPWSQFSCCWSVRPSRTLPWANRCSDIVFSFVFCHFDDRVRSSFLHDEAIGETNSNDFTWFT